MNKSLLYFAALFTLSALILVVVSAAPGLFATSAAGKSNNWPQWRGANGSGVSEETGLPAEWSPDKNIRWKTPIPGQGHSSPIIWGDRIFLTTDLEGPPVPGAKAVIHYEGGKEFKHPDSIGADHEHTFKVLCVGRRSGKLLWERTAYKGTVYDDRHRKGSYASATAATDGKHVYAWFGSEGIFCYDFSGKEIWKRSLGPIATFGMGPGTSPVLYENKLILLCDEDNGDKSFIAALDKQTGTVLWKTPRKVQASWATPMVVRANRQAEVICSGNEWIISYDPQSGKEIWRAKGLNSNAIPSPLAGHGMAYVYAGFPAKKTLAIKLGSSGDVTGTPNIVWQYEKGTAYVPSGILYGDYLYLTSDRGILTCLDARTGAVQYEGGRIPKPATFTASLLAVDGKVLLTSEDGETFMVKAGPKHEVLGTNSIGEPVYSTPAISQGMIFIRGEKNLYCIGSDGRR